jgi:poly(A) polymerase
VISKFIRKLCGAQSKQNKQSDLVVVSRKQHSIAQNRISRNAMTVISKLNSAKFEAYLVGGGVRDILLGKHPKDFDVSTSAKPEQVYKLFRNSRLIGRRFRLAHVYFKGEIIEVSTFRGGQTADKTLAHDNEYGSLEEDAWRRDFTVNALYLRASDLAVLDYTGGMQDLEKKLLRMIGDPQKRYHEDPVRMLRAIRLAAKLDLTIEEQTSAQIKPCLHLLDLVPSARIYDEVLKMLFAGHAVNTVARLKQYAIWQKIFPLSDNVQNDKDADKLFAIAFKATDSRVKTGKSINPGFLFSVLLFPQLSARFAKFKGEKKQFLELRTLAKEIIFEQIQSLRIPKRLQIMMTDVWLLQLHLERRRPSSAMTLLRQRYFRAAFDLLEMRSQFDPSLQATCAAWKDMRDANFNQRTDLIQKWRQELSDHNKHKQKSRRAQGETGDSNV